MSDAPLVQVEDLHRSFGSVSAVRGVSFALRRGEVLGFLGLNGAGKSTTMAMLAGVLAPSSGRIRIAGHDLQAQPLSAKAALGYLPDVPPLYEQQSVSDFLGYAARLRGMAGAQHTTAVEHAMQRCGLTQVSKRLLGNLSKGYRQRVGIAQAIVHEPQVLILDEPTSGLDPAQLRSIRALVRELASDHAVILSTHILPEAQKVCDRVQIMHGGRLVHEGAIAQARSSADWFRVRLAQAPGIGPIRALPQVGDCEPDASGAFRLRLAPGCRADALSRALVEKGYGLLELSPEQPSLEDLFTSITLGEEPEQES